MAGHASTSVTNPRPVPARAGIGLRAEHHGDVREMHPDVGWLEVHSENHFASAGPAHLALEELRGRYPLSMHGVGMSLGGTDPLDHRHLSELRAAIARYQPALVSEHLCWSSAGGRHSNDLLPLPYTQEALRHVATRVDQAQEFLGRRLLIENVSAYLSFRGAEMTEWEFLGALAKQTGCGLLLDVNNVYVSSCNLGFEARRYLAGLPPESIGEIHLAGHSARSFDDGVILVDTHDAPVRDEVWALYAEAIARLGAVPTLIEWDVDLPPLNVLVAEAQRADRLMGDALALAA